MDNLIIIDTKEKSLMFCSKADIKILLSKDILIGKNGVAVSKLEGDGKTPIRRISSWISIWHA